MKKFILFIAFISALPVQSQTPNLQWAKKLGDISNDDQGISLSNDNNGNVYSVGKFYGNIDADPSASTYYLYTAGGWDTYISKLDNSGNFVWAKKIGGINDDVPTEIVVDQSGNSYVSGSFSGVVDFDPSSTGTFTLNGAAFADNFILKLDALGNFVWVKQFSSTGNDIITSITLDNAGKLLCTGRLYGVMDFDPSPIATFTMSGGGSGAISIPFFKLDANGNFIWAKKFASSTSSTSHGIRSDAQNNIYVSGFYYQAADFDPSASVYSLTAIGNTQDAFVAKFDANGNFKWANSYGSIYYDDAFSSTIDTKGNVYTTGYFGGTADFDPSSTGTYTIANNNSSNDVFVVKVDSLGGFVWAKKIGGDYDDRADYIISDNANNVYVCGGYEYICDFNPSTTATYTLTSNGAKDGYITKLDENGNFVWNASFGGISEDRALCVKIDNSGSVISTGYYERTIDFDPASGTFNLSGNTGNSDAFVWKLNSTAAGINSINKNPLNVLIYPNPVREVLHVNIEAGLEFYETNLKLTNLIGEVVLAETFISNDFTLNTNNLAIGVYLVTIENKNGISNKKIIIE